MPKNETLEDVVSKYSTDHVFTMDECIKLSKLFSDMAKDMSEASFMDIACNGTKEDAEKEDSAETPVSYLEMLRLVKGTFDDYASIKHEKDYETRPVMPLVMSLRNCKATPRDLWQLMRRYPKESTEHKVLTKVRDMLFSDIAEDMDDPSNGDTTENEPETSPEKDMSPMISLRKEMIFTQSLPPVGLISYHELYTKVIVPIIRNDIREGKDPAISLVNILRNHRLEPRDLLAVMRNYPEESTEHKVLVKVGNELFHDDFVRIPDVNFEDCCKMHVVMSELFEECKPIIQAAESDEFKMYEVASRLRARMQSQHIKPLAVWMLMAFYPTNSIEYRILEPVKNAMENQGASIPRSERTEWNGSYRQIVIEQFAQNIINGKFPNIDKGAGYAIEKQLVMEIPSDWALKRICDICVQIIAHIGRDAMINIEKGRSDLTPQYIQQLYQTIYIMGMVNCALDKSEVEGPVTEPLEGGI